MDKAFTRDKSPGDLAYWLKSAFTALFRKSLKGFGVGQSGNPCPRFTALCCTASGVNSCQTVGLSRLCSLDEDDEDNEEEEDEKEKIAVNPTNIHFNE